MEEKITPVPPSIDPPIQHTEPQNWQKDHHTPKYLTIGLIIALAIGGYAGVSKYLGTWPLEREVVIPIFTPRFTPTPTPTPIPTPTPTPSEYLKIKIYHSPDRQYSFSVYTVDRQGPSKCYFSIVNKNGTSLYLNETIGLNQISCGVGGGGQGLFSSFIGWKDDNKFLLDENEGEIMIVDVNEFTKNTYAFNSNDLDFINANKSLNYWLFRKKPRDGKNVVYTLLDNEKNVATEDISGLYDRPVLYDDINDGFLFIDRTYNTKDRIQDVSVRLDFLSMETLKLRTILITEPTIARGMGCYAEYLISKPGEVILTRGCLTVKEKYVGEDGNIHIKL